MYVLPFTLTLNALAFFEDICNCVREHNSTNIHIRSYVHLSVRCTYKLSVSSQQRLVYKIPLTICTLHGQHSTATECSQGGHGIGEPLNLQPLLDGQQVRTHFRVPGLEHYTHTEAEICDMQCMLNGHCCHGGSGKDCLYMYALWCVCCLYRAKDHMKWQSTHPRSHGCCFQTKMWGL